MLFTCIKSWFFRNHLGNSNQISHWSYCWNVIESLFKWLRSIDCLENLFFFTSSKLKDHLLTRNLVGSIRVTCRSKNAQMVAIRNLKLRLWWPSWKSVLNFFPWTEWAIDLKFIGSIEVTCRSTVAKSHSDWKSKMATILFMFIIFPCHCAVYMYKIMILQKPLRQ